MEQLQLEITARGYLIVPAKMAAQRFPEDVCVAMWRKPELWILPIHRQASGGLLMKQRNLEGDRSVLVWDALPFEVEANRFPAFWDDEQKALRIGIADAETKYQPK